VPYRLIIIECVLSLRIIEFYIKRPTAKIVEDLIILIQSVLITEGNKANYREIVEKSKTVNGQ
jgi:hypothetical protein